MSAPSSTFTIGIIQDHATADGAANVARAERLVRDAAQAGRADHLPERTVQRAVLLQVAAVRPLRSRRADPRTDHRRDVPSRARTVRRARRADVRASGGRASIAIRQRSSTPTAACSASTGRCTFRTTRCSTRSITSRHGDTPGLPGVEDALRDDRRADLLGPVVSGSGAHHQPDGRAGALLPDRDRLASVREGRMGTGAGRRLAHDSALARDRQRRVRRRRRTASATRTSPARTASTFSATRSSPIRSAATSPRPATAKRS